MKVTLTPEESENLFHNSLCNALDYMYGYGLELHYNEDEYESALAKLSSPCFEDVLMQILKDGNKLTMVDIECDGAYTSSVTLKDVHERVQDTDIRHLMDAINEEDDADTADVILQQVFFKETIFG